MMTGDPSTRKKKKKKAPVAFYSVPLALLLAVPCGYIAWMQVRQWRQATHRDDHPQE